MAGRARCFEAETTEIVSDLRGPDRTATSVSTRRKTGTDPEVKSAEKASAIRPKVGGFNFSVSPRACDDRPPDDYADGRYQV